MTERGLEKAYLEAKGTGDRLTCTFNPKEISIAKSATWKQTEASGAQQAPTPEFTGTKPRTLTMELLFDGWDSGAGDVTADVDRLFDWTCPTEESLRNNKPQPPIIVLHWGQKSYFECYVKSVKAKYTMFDAQGNVLRAEVNTTFEQTPDDAARQNPTSGGIAGRRLHTLIDGETLQSIAYREYRKPALWRALAEANGIDDPLRVRPGTTILVPPASALGTG